MYLEMHNHLLKTPLSKAMCVVIHLDVQSQAGYWYGMQGPHSIWRSQFTQVGRREGLLFP